MTVSVGTQMENVTKSEGTDKTIFCLEASAFTGCHGD